MSPDDLPLLNYIDQLQRSLNATNEQIGNYEYKTKKLKNFNSSAQIRTWNKKLKKLYRSRKILTNQIKNARTKLDKPIDPLHGPTS